MHTKDEKGQETYPRIYKVDKATRCFFYGFGVFLIAFIVVTTPLHLLGVLRNPIPPLALALGEAAFVCNPL